MEFGDTSHASLMVPPASKRRYLPWDRAFGCRKRRARHISQWYSANTSASDGNLKGVFWRLQYALISGINLFGTAPWVPGVPYNVFLSTQVSSSYKKTKIPEFSVILLYLASHQWLHIKLPKIRYPRRTMVHIYIGVFAMVCSLAVSLVQFEPFKCHKGGSATSKLILFRLAP
ncbi:hypothetical protein DFH07DRAFT_405775 [Mycena maculata]|uniref:Uncharacterized protein n=1 Tax=Mycena maculata TaxID=230809 RepID=A0AAD7NJ54_9AGAR|nr:hypothetical protein DFH07DRAFT_405775 [Mycena maculata]